ncbi:hypothetical protein A0257_07860 [Hymenobacter psoromatis]|nr:hypothetical protein A0257_07860 [Hymenobacter psoromatis]
MRLPKISNKKISAEMYPKQGLYNLDSRFAFGKYAGLSVTRVYSGNHIELVNRYREMLYASFEKIFSKETYKEVDNRITGPHINIEGIDEEGWVEFILAFYRGAQCDFIVDGNKVKLVVSKGGMLDKKLSKFACELASKYMTGDLQQHWVNGIGKLRPGIEFYIADDFEDKLNAAEPNPEYIYWCIRNVDGFCLPGNKNEITGLNESPMFDFDSFKTKDIKADFSFEFQMNLKVHFKSADKRTITENYRKLTEYLEDQKTLDSRQEYYSDDDNEGYYDNEKYYDRDDDEENIMRGLESGNGDQFGF